MISGHEYMRFSWLNALLTSRLRVQRRSVYKDCLAHTSFPVPWLAILLLLSLEQLGKHILCRLVIAQAYEYEITLLSHLDEVLAHLCHVLCLVYKRLRLRCCTVVDEERRQRRLTRSHIAGEVEGHALAHVAQPHPANLVLRVRRSGARVRVSRWCGVVG